MSTACQFDPYTLRYMKTKPDPGNIIGSWVATDATLRDLAGTPYAKARPMISIGADGSITMADIPDTWSDLTGKGKGQLETFVGTWTLDKTSDWWGVALKRGSEWGCFGCLMVLGHAPPYGLVIRLGDPDEGDGYEFRKVR